jgi:hypothetical protein
MGHLKSLKVWAYGLVSSVVSGACGAVSVMFVDPKDFNFDTGLGNLAKVFAGAGLIALVNFLQRQPLPAWDPTRDSDRRA